MLDIKSIKNKAVYFLARREHSYSELLQKLSRYTDDIDTIKQVLEQLKEQNLLSEERCIQNYLSSKSNKYSISKLKYDLFAKVKDTELVEHLIAEAQIDQYATALNIWQKKFGEKADTTKEEEKQMRFLLSRGFSYDIIIRVMNTRLDID